MLSMKTRYAMKALLALARMPHRNPVLISAIAESENIPKKFLELILLELKGLGILASKKGKHGGYYLRGDLSKVNMGQVVRGIDGPIALLSCVSQTQYARCVDCPDENTCGLRLVFKEVRDVTARILEKATLGEVLKRCDEQQPETPVSFDI